MLAVVPDRPRVGVFTSTLVGSPVAAARFARLNRTLSAAAIQLVALKGVTHGSAHARQYSHIRRLMVRAAEAASLDVAIVADDDFDAAPDFIQKLVAALRVLPSDWQSLHLCPGWRWGRSKHNSVSFRVQRKLASWQWLSWEAGLAPKAVTAQHLRLDASGRVITNVEELAQQRRVLHLGGPIAFAARPSALPGMIREYDAAWRAWNHTIMNDALLLNISSRRDFVAYQPILCVENEIGGSFYPRKAKDPTSKMIEKARQAQLESGKPEAANPVSQAWLLVCMAVLLVGVWVALRQ